MNKKNNKQIFNPYLPSYEYIPDGEPHIFGDRLYIYGSHDRFGGSDYCENDYVCWSAPVDDIATQCGFKYSSYFNRQFTKCLGITPSEFRKNPTGYSMFEGGKIGKL